MGVRERLDTDQVQQKAVVVGVVQMRDSFRFPLSIPTFSPFFCRAQRPDGVGEQRNRRRHHFLAPSVTPQAAAAAAGAAVSALPGVVRRLRRPRESRHAGEGGDGTVKFIF